jgi:hypothetical protein
VARVNAVERQRDEREAEARAAAERLRAAQTAAGRREQSTIPKSDKLQAMRHEIEAMRKAMLKK